MDYGYDMQRLCVYGEDRFMQPARIVAFLTREELAAWKSLDCFYRREVMRSENADRAEEFARARDECFKR